MAAQLIDGKAIAQLVRDEVKESVAEWISKGNLAPGLATVLVGNDPGSAVYVGNKQKASAEVGIVGLGGAVEAGDDGAVAVEQDLVEVPGRRLSHASTCGAGRNDRPGGRPRAPPTAPA